MGSTWKLILVLVGLAGLLATSLLGQEGASTQSPNSGGAAATPATPEVTKTEKPASLAKQIIGVWQGTWNTTRGEGDSGPLKCTLTGLTNGTYNARFRATYKKILPFVTSVELHAVQKDGYIEVNGSTKLADWAGGNYVYTGKIQGDSFICSYTSDKDTGLFEMTRAK